MFAGSSKCSQIPASFEEQFGKDVSSRPECIFKVKRRMGSFLECPADFDGTLKDKDCRIRTGQYLEGRSPRNSRAVG